MKFNRKTFFAGYRKRFGALKQDQVDGLEFLLTAFETDATWKDVRHIAYALATIKHETANTFKPIKEYRARVGSKGRANQDRYWLSGYYGRGYVQITWKRNYEKFGIAETPEKALEPETAFWILTAGMHRGLFTGKKLSDFIKGSTCDYNGARKIINGTDKNILIAGYAKNFEKLLSDARETQNSAVASGPSTKDIPTDNPTGTSANSTADQTNVENLQINESNQSVAPVGFVPEEKVAEAPPKEGSTSAAAKTTILGITVPAGVYAVVQAIQEWIEKGYIDIKAILAGLLDLIRNNVKYVSILVGLLIAVILVKKIFKQITFLLTLYINSRPDLHDVTVVPASVDEAKKAWWRFWE